METDISLFTKIKGTEDTFEEVDMANLAKSIRLPAIDYTVKWNMKSKCQPWRRTSPDARKVVLKSLGGTEDGGSKSKSSQLEPAKKKNKGASADSHKSGDKAGKDSSSDPTKRKENVNMETDQ